MYFGYNHQQSAHPHSLSLPSQSINQGINQSTLNKSILLEAPVVTLQRESESYIRKVEFEKKHYYSVEETWALVQKEWTEKKERMNEVDYGYISLYQKQIQKIKQSPQQKLLHSKISNRSNDLEQAISKCNETQSFNKALQKQIDSLRKERVQFLNIESYLRNELNEVNKETYQLTENQKEQEGKTQKSKEAIGELKKKNDSEKEVYVSQFDRLQKEVLDEKRQRDVTKMAARKEKNETIDTSSLLKQRLKRLIFNNKEKVKVIEHYLKNMKVIDEAFTQIKEASGITDIDEIMNTFIKSEEQNYSLYNYVDVLSQEIDTLAEQNQDFSRKIELQEKDNENRIKQLKETPITVRHKRKTQNIIAAKQKEIDTLRTKMEEIGPDLQQALIELGATKLVYHQILQNFITQAEDPNRQFDYQLTFNLNESSLKQYLQDLEYYINILVAKQQLALNDSVIQNTLLLDQIPAKDFNSSRIGQPNIQVEENPQDQPRLLDQKKLRQIALETIENKKKTK